MTNKGHGPGNTSSVSQNMQLGTTVLSLALLPRAGNAVLQIDRILRGVRINVRPAIRFR
jgi:hypothetical protein